MTQSAATPMPFLSGGLFFYDGKYRNNGDDVPFFVITGASGGGKSTILDELEQRGYQVQPEIGREIVKDQLANGGAALPWLDAQAFNGLLFERSVAAYRSHQDQNGKPVFFDRSFIECVAFSKILGKPVPERMLDISSTLRFANPVFICPPWAEIFRKDQERQHDFLFAQKDYEANRAAYEELDYELVSVPKAPAAERADFILETALQNSQV